MPLFIAPVGVNLKVINIKLETKTKKHLQNLGLTIDSIIQIVSQEGRGTVLNLLGSRVALDHDLASKIYVSTL